VSDIISRINAALEGRYRIVREIGEGGMATVFLADDLRHERKVALKVLKPELAAVVGADRFLAEIKTTANLQHPHILPLFDSGEADKFLYYVMPFVEGETLQDWLDREKQLPVDEAVRIAVAVAGALGYAHKHGVVHRDIKPGNILIQAGQPMVGDFGIALAVGAAGGARLTETGLSVGTPYYMSPEQATGDMAVGPASDIYALGAVLYEILTGDPPYMGSTAQAVLGKILQGVPVSATAVRRSIPANVDAAIRKSLEKLPADRFTSATEFAVALQDTSFNHGAVAKTASAGGLWNPVSIGASAAAAVFAVIAAWALFTPEPVEPALRFSLNTAENDFASEWIALSPMGNVMVSSHPDDQGNWGLFVRRFADLGETRIPNVEAQVNDPVISPDGTEVAFFDNGTLKVAPLGGGLIRTISDDAACCGRWGGDGFFYYNSFSGNNIQRVPVTGGAKEVVLELTDDESAGQGYYHPIPGRDAALFSVFSSPPRVVAIDLGSGERHVVTEGIRSYLTPTGHLVFGALDGRVLAAPFDEGSLQLSGPIVPLIEGVTIRNADVAYSVAETGDLLYWRGPVASAAAEFVWVTREGRMTPVDPGWSFSPGSGNYGFRLSPDGTRLAYRDRGGGDDGEIWVKDLDEGPLSRLTFDPASEASPEWSADGRTIYFNSTRTDPADRTIWSRNADGTGEPLLVLDPVRTMTDFTLSPDGVWAVFRTGDPPSRDLVAQRMDGDGEAVPLLSSPDFDEVGPQISPDGRWLAYASNETGTYQIYVRPFPDVEGGRWQVSTAGGAGPRWSHSGNEIFYGSVSGEMVSARVDTSSGFRVLGTDALFQRQQTLAEALTNGWFDVAPDDQRFIMARPLTIGGSSVEPELILIQNFFTELERLVPN